MKICLETEQYLGSSEIMQSEDPVKVRLQGKLDEEVLEQRVKPFPQSEQERMTQQMTESIAKQLRITSQL
jgi:hypothetical protein